MSSMKAQIFNKSITDIITERKSIRTYRNQPIDEDIKEKISNYSSKLSSPFNGKVRFKLIDSKVASKTTDVKLGTYGVIRGTSTFIATAVEKETKDLEELGYRFEELILYATSLGLGTCWLGGTFKKGDFAKAIELKENEVLPIVTPIGYPSENIGIIDSIFRFASGSKHRKPWNELFFNDSFSNPMEEGIASDYSVPLEMVRLAPSASNKQPWRIIKKGKYFHFYLYHAKGYSSTLGFDIQRIDIGIVMSHFELTAKEMGLKGIWCEVDPKLEKNLENLEYKISWQFY